MQNTQENFPNVPINELSKWSVIRKSDGAKFDVVEHQSNGQISTDISFNEEGTERIISFTPGVGEQLQNEEYAVVFTHGREPVIDHNGTVVTE